jgi:hypothetical protein
MSGDRSRPVGRVHGRPPAGDTSYERFRCQNRPRRRGSGRWLWAVVLAACLANADTGQGGADEPPLSVACRSLLCRSPGVGCEFSDLRPAVATAGVWTSVSFSPHEDAWDAAPGAGSSSAGGGAWEFVAELLSAPSSLAGESSGPAIPSAVYSVAPPAVSAAGGRVSVAVAVESAGAYHLALGRAQSGDPSPRPPSSFYPLRLWTSLCNSPRRPRAGPPAKHASRLGSAQPAWRAPRAASLRARRGNITGPRSDGNP